MGQGYSLTTPSAGSAGIDVPELGDLVYEKSIGSARFMKSIRARHHDGVVLVKVLVKPYQPMSLAVYRDKLLRERRILADVPNALAYQRIVEKDTNGYLVRQFLYNSLYDRMSTRPFLEDIEKKWLAFQLLCALRDCHARDVYHGDIKTENVLVTSWNWLYLTDFSSAFKPVLLPDDNPADFSYFFDTSGRRTCYLAPERFVPSETAAEATEDDEDDDEMEEGYDDDEDDQDTNTGSSSRRRPGTGAKGKGKASPRSKSRGGRSRGRSSQPGTPPNHITWAMDVFSVGCVIAELVLEAPIFSLSQLFRYRRGEYDPTISHLSRIPDRDLADMIAHMIQLDPQKRYAAHEYLDFYRGKVFPEYFYSFLHQYMELITDPSSGQYPASGATRNMGEADERIDRVYYDFDKISYFLGFQDESIPDAPGGSTDTSAANEPKQRNAKSLVKASGTGSPPLRLGLGLFPVRLSIPTEEHFVQAGAQPTADNGALIFLTLIVASIRNTARSASKIRACEVLLALSERLTDEAKLDRVLPYLMALLNDRADMVVVAAVRSIAQLLVLVRTVSPVNAHVFLEYIMPRMQSALLNGGNPALNYGNGRETSPIVRATYAACLGTLAATANRFLEMAARVDRMVGAADDADLEAGSSAAAAALPDTTDEDPVFDGALFDMAQRDLVDMFELHTKILIEDTDPYVRRAFLTSVPDLCLFFGAADANDIIVTHLNTYLNDRDWMLKCAFFDTIVGVATFLGSVSLEEFILPLMIQALTDPEEHVVQAVLQALAELADVGLFSKKMIWDLVEVVARFTVHPNIWIRETAARFLSAATKFLSPAQVRCMFMPLIMAYVKPGMLTLNSSELQLLDQLQKPLSRAVFDQALNWAMKADRGAFWKPVQKLRGFPFGMSSSSLSSSPSSGPTGSSGRSLTRDVTPRLLSKVQRNEEDEQWINRLRNLGLSTEDEFKLLALRGFIWRLSRLKIHETISPASGNGYGSRASNASTHGGETGYDGTPTPDLNSIISLVSLGIKIQNVIFEEEPLSKPIRPPPLPGTLAAAMDFDSNAPRSIEDALHDASMTIDDPIAKRRRAALNIHKNRMGSRSGASLMSGSPSPAVRDGFLTAANSGEPSSPTSSMAQMASSPTDDAASIRSAQAAGTPPDETALLSDASKRGLSLRHRPSAISLLNHRKDSIKSGAETSTTETNAFGQVEGRSALTGSIQSRSPVPSDDFDSTGSDPEGPGSGGRPGGSPALNSLANRYRGHHSYAGNDPNVLRMLDAMFIQNYPHDATEFSPSVVPISSRKKAAASNSSGNSNGGGASSGRRSASGSGGNSNGSSGAYDGWKPSGQMVATFSEHTGAINRVVVSPDHVFFLTGGDDSSVRIWDTQRLERNISRRSRQIHWHAADARVLALCFIENTHCFISCASDGGVHVVKVECDIVPGTAGMPRYSRPRLLREYQLPRDEWAVWCEHFKHDGKSVMVLATNRSRVLGIDLRTMTLVFVLMNPVHHGTPTCFVVDRKHNWLVVATSHGVLDLWDLRFKMRLKGWGIPGGAPIYRLSIHPSKGRGKWICVAGGTGQGEVTVWDLDKTLCREVYRIGNGGSSSTTPTATTSLAKDGTIRYNYEPWDVDEDRPEGMLGRFATSIDPAGVSNGGTGGASAGINVGGGNGSGNGGAGGDKGMRAMVVGASSVDDQRDVRHAFIVTGGSDKKLRFWDLSRIEASTIYSGQLPDDGRPTYTATPVTTAMTVNIERQPRGSVAATTGTAGSADGKKGSATARAKAASNGGTAPAAASASGSSTPRPSRSTVIAMQQQQLLRSHLDAILDAALLESPYMATISVDRMGVIFVFS
ncbi:phosphoinositide 3-kinase regulatory subunit 4 [Ophiostoma piceae UAMH 11346]|uniref:non-specific serine/threonine protein kinase n=1 Tax=Ophiostoma piceae (strain UAMH 11346) TaxID=1262450 RepID=S3C8U2_OPHP1|nr:phosphoinositide 3-kinase regulatory subunit 4 [Ophiostoma piceae UAMH 11346]